MNSTLTLIHSTVIRQHTESLTDTFSCFYFAMGHVAYPLDRPYVMLLMNSQILLNEHSVHTICISVILVIEEA